MATKGRFIRTDTSPDNIRALWERLHALDDQITAANTTITQQASTITTLQTQVKTVQAQAAQASITAGQPNQTVSSTGVPTPTPTPSPITDNGQGSLGCSEAGADGHLAAGFPVDVESAGKIICGTGKEFPALLAAVGSQAIRDANRLELVQRMIWHLNLYGFQASAYIVSGTITNAYVIILRLPTGTLYGYRVVNYEDFTQTMTTTMEFVGIDSYIGAGAVGFAPQPGTSD